MELLVILVIIWFVLKKKKPEVLDSIKQNLGASKYKMSAKSGQRASAVPNVPGKRKESAVPNKPKQMKRTKEEVEVLVKTKASKADCHYEAAYSKGRPDRLGMRGDYEDVVPKGMVRVRCGYCNADNFVPAGTQNHYHCYFCWEKL